MLMSESFVGNLHCSFGILSKYNNKKYMYLKGKKLFEKLGKVANQNMKTFIANFFKNRFSPLFFFADYEKSYL